jgi:hypothetical protein
MHLPWERVPEASLQSLPKRAWRPIGYEELKGSTSS